MFLLDQTNVPKPDFSLPLFSQPLSGTLYGRAASGLAGRLSTLLLTQAAAQDAAVYQPQARAA